MWALYIYDCISVMFFGTDPTFRLSEFPVLIPCEVKVWEARTSMEWFRTLSSDSRYGGFYQRILGASIPEILSKLRRAADKQLEYSASQLATSMVAMVTEIHSALVLRSKNTSLFSTLGCVPVLGSPSRILVLGEWLDLSEVRLMLHNWLHGWRKCSEVFTREESDSGQFFCYSNLAQFYGTAHVMLFAYQKPDEDFAWEGLTTLRATSKWLAANSSREEREKFLDWEEAAYVPTSGCDGKGVASCPDNCVIHRVHRVKYGIW
jgi:hypothetical protein